MHSKRMIVYHKVCNISLRSTGLGRALVRSGTCFILIMLLCLSEQSHFHVFTCTNGTNPDLSLAMPVIKLLLSANASIGTVWMNVKPEMNGAFCLIKTSFSFDSQHCLTCELIQQVPEEHGPAYVHRTLGKHPREESDPDPFDTSCSPSKQLQK